MYRVYVDHLCIREYTVYIIISLHSLNDFVSLGPSTLRRSPSAEWHCQGRCLHWDQGRCNMLQPMGHHWSWSLMKIEAKNIQKVDSSQQQIAWFFGCHGSEVDLSLPGVAFEPRLWANHEGGKSWFCSFSWFSNFYVPRDLHRSTNLHQDFQRVLSLKSSTKMLWIAGLQTIIEKAGCGVLGPLCHSLAGSEDRLATETRRLKWTSIFSNTCC